VTQEHLAESIKAATGEVGRALKPTLTRGELPKRAGVVRARQWRLS